MFSGIYYQLKFLGNISNSNHFNGTGQGGDPHKESLHIQQLGYGA